MQLKANAKINLGLFITERRSDGFHNIESLFIPVDWSDDILIEDSNEFRFTSEGIDIPESANGNHCIQAFNIINSKYGISNVHIHLKKQIPIGAGLGGGSSDAAFVLKGLNQKFKLNINKADLELMSNQIGSDCPFFIKNKTAFVTGTGNQFDYDLNASFEGYCVIVYPNIFISTKEAYEGVVPQKANFNLKDIGKHSIINWKEFIKNDFEKPLSKKYPIIESIKEKLYNAGAFYTSLSGSGSTVYGLFSEKPELENLFLDYQFKISKVSI